MIQVTFDPSMLSGKTNQSDLEISIGFSGCFLEPADAVPVDMHILYPWTWQSRPTYLRVWWFKPDGTLSRGPEDLKIATPEIAPDTADAKQVKEHIERLIAEKRGKSTDWQKEITWDITNQYRSTMISDDNMVTQSAGFFVTAISQFAQKFPPLNESLGLVFFAKDATLKPPADATLFAAFPINTAPNDYWVPVDNTLIDNIPNHKALKYTMASGLEMTAYCPLTAVPTPWTNDQPIELRDADGKFSGLVKIQVNDIEDWALTLAQGLSSFFEIPQNFVQYLMSHTAGIIWTPPAVNPDVAFKEYKGWLKQLENLIWATLRDHLNFGISASLNGKNALEIVASEFIKLSSSNQGTETEDPDLQKEQYKKILVLQSQLFDLVSQYENNTLTLEGWISLIKIDHPFLKEWWNQLSVDGWSYTDQDDLQIKITNWLNAWAKVIDCLNDESLQREILVKQWKELDVSILLPNIQTDWFDKIFSNIGNIQLRQKGASAQMQLPILYRFLKSQDIDAQEIRGFTRDAVRKYTDDRIKGSDSYYPKLVQDPFANPPQTLPGTVNWSDFLDSIDTQIPLDTVTRILDELVKKKFNAPPQLMVKVASFPDQLKTDQEDDLSDEISGHVLLSRRSQNINEAVNNATPWDYLNWAKLDLKELTFTTNGGKTIVNGTSHLLDNSYLIPAFISDNGPDGGLNPFFKLSNEKSSIIAGVDTYGDQNDDTKMPDGITTTNIVEYNADDNKQASALWYGYNYEFAAFVALNTGVLPEGLRSSPTHWNIPATAPNVTNSSPYRHLRRVPVSGTSIAIKGAKGEDGGKPLPKGVLPLAFELPTWRGSANSAITQQAMSGNITRKGNDQSHFILTAPGRTAGYQQSELMLNLRKPTTSYWNWHAWMGEESAEPYIDDAGVSHNDKSWSTVGLGRELELRSNTKNNGTQVTDHVFDPAVDDKLLVVVEKVFPVSNVASYSCFINLSSPDKLRGTEKQLKIKIGNTAPTAQQYCLQEGEIVTVKIHSRIKKVYFEEGNAEQRFYSWMAEGLEPSNEFYLSEPVEIWFEAAKVPEIVQGDLWDNLSIQYDGEKVKAYFANGQIYKKAFSYLSRAEVKYQVWNWNGKTTEDQLLLEALSTPDNLDPVGSTTKAMEWEAWAFSDRPDFSALVHETNLLCSTDASPTPQLLFAEQRPGEDKALYYRFGLTAYGRYELLGGDYSVSFNAVKTIVDGVITGEDRWRRLLRKCQRTKSLPRPTVRFILPLTKSISECGDHQQVSSASLLIVLDDRWFAEAGIAEKLNIGIELVSPPAAKDEPTVDKLASYYLNAGNDPILTGVAMSPVSRNGVSANSSLLIENPPNGNPIAVFEPRAISGLTFDLNAQTPKLKGCAFVVDIPDLQSIMIPTVGTTQALKPWSMMKIAVRRMVHKEMYAGSEGGGALLNSEWTPGEWVQFLPAIDSFVPGEWRTQVALKDYIDLKFLSQTEIQIPRLSLPRFDDVFEERMERFLIITENVFNIGGQPTERYIGSFIYNTGKDVLPINHPPQLTNQDTITDGYVRIMLVRKDINISRDNYLNTSIWDHLFGEHASGRPSAGTVLNDPGAALPVVSERVPYKVMKQ